MERHPDELWSSYLIRRLEAEGFRFKDGEVGAENVIGFELLPPPYANLDISRWLVGEETIDSLVKERSLGRQQRSYGDYQCPLLEAEWVGLGTPTRPDALYRQFRFSAVGMVLVGRLDEEAGPLPDYLMKYAFDQIYSAREVVEDIVRYCRENKREFPPQEETLSPEEAVTRPYGVPGGAGIPERREKKLPPKSERKIPALERRIEELHKDVRKLLGLAGEHPVVLKGEGAYLQELYVRAINERIDNLRFLEYRGKRIPYVLVHSFDLEGDVGKPFHNLYFVARDVAPEEWQQQIVAYHESFCLHFSHERAQAEARRLARSLGKEKEYSRWLKTLEGKLK